MSPLKKMIILASAIGLFGPVEAGAEPAPVDPIEVVRSGQIGGSAPHVSPNGGQIVTYRTQIPTGMATELIERSNGGAFSAPVELTRTASAEDPSLSFTPDDGIYAAWGINNSSAEQTFRPSGGEFVPATAMAGCGRFVDSAAGPDGAIAVTCSFSSMSLPPDTYGLGTSPTLGPVAISEQLIQPFYDQFIQPAVSWGSDGTLAVVADYWATLSNPPPVNQTRRIRVVLRNPAAGLASTSDLGDVTQPADVFVSGRPAVLGDGTVAVSTGGTAGARVLIRPPGTMSSFAPHTLNGVAATEPQSDNAQNLHVMSAGPEEPNRQYWSNIRPPGGSFGVAVPIPLAGSGQPYIPYEGFEVAPDGTEFALIRANDGVYATSRGPGESAFTTPRRLGDSATSNPEGAITEDGDLLVVWTHEVALGDYQTLVGGLDETPPKVTIGEFPRNVRAGAPVGFSAEATDQMGMRSVSWAFGEGTPVDQGSVSHTFIRGGTHQVTFTATDRAGNETTIRRPVEVQGGTGAQPNIKLTAPKKLRFRVLARKGIKLKVISDRPVRIKAAIGTSKRNARLKPMGKKAIKKFKARHTFRVKPKKRRLGKPRKFKLFIQVTGTTAKGQRATRTAKVRIVRR